MASEVPIRAWEPNCEGPMGGFGWESVSDSWSRRRTILSRVLLRMPRRCIDRQLLGCVYDGLLAFGIGTTTAFFQLEGCRPDRRITVYMLLRQVGWARWRMLSSDALTVSGPVADEAGVEASAAVTSLGRIGGMSGDLIGGTRVRGPARWWSARHFAMRACPE